MVATNPGTPAVAPRMAAVLAAVVYAATGAALAFPLAVTQVAAAVAVGAGAGAVLGQRLAASRLRLLAIGVAAALLVSLMAGLRGLLLGNSWPTSFVGPAAALRLTDTLVFGAGALCCASALRAAALRRRFLSILEVGLVALAFAQLVVAHRNGAINRPFELADPVIAAGGDPTLVFLTVGAVAAAVIILLLLAERSVLRAVLHLAVAVVILFLILSSTVMLGLPQPPAPGTGLGLRPEQGEDGQKKAKSGQKGDQKRGGRRSNEDLEFRDNYDASANRVPLAVVLLHDDFSPPNGVYYFRQDAFSQYNGRKLVRAVRAGLDEDLAEFFPTTRTLLYDVPNLLGDRATLDTTVALLADHKHPFALESPIALKPGRNPDPGRFRRVYRATSAALSSDVVALLGRKAGSAGWNAGQWRHYTQVPQDARYGELAREIVSGIREELRQDPMAQALAITVWLSEQGIYSLRSSHARAADPAADFLFGDKTGYCVHFAHASVYLMRFLGLPARIATGYVAEESARRGGSTIVLSGQNSHAWPEVYLADVGWLVMDVTPQRSLDPPPQPPDPDLQRLLGEMVRGQRPLPHDGRWSYEPVAAVVRHAWRWLGLLSGAVLLALLSGLYAVKAWRRWLAPRFARPRAVPRVLYRAELDRLAEVRLRRHFGESRERFATRAASVCPSFVPLTHAHLKSVFGTLGGQPESRHGAVASVVRDLGRRTRAELRASTPHWHRILGALNPWAWLRVR